MALRRASRRYYRTLLLGLAALALLLWAAVDQFGIERRELIDLALGSLLVAAMAILAAGSVALLWIALRWLWRRRDSR